MKILIPYTISSYAAANPYVRLLRDSLLSHGHSVECSRDVFWEAPTKFDLIYFQWPEGILNQDKTGPDIEQIIEHIAKIKKTNTLICITIHNLHPHINRPLVSNLYDLLYRNADAFHHMGDYSFAYLKDKYPNAFHFIAPHPIYYDVEKIGMSVDECKNKYGIRKDKITIIAFGAFRNDEERSLLLDLKKKMSRKICFWAPKFYSDFFSIKKINNAVLRMLSNFYNYLKYRLQGIIMNRNVISDDEVLPMINAADILLIQRKDILNSGNLPLGFSAKKIVVGPDVGNVGNILKKTNNPVFDPNNDDTIYQAVKQGIDMFCNSDKQGIYNYQYAKHNWTPQMIADKINEALETLEKKVKHEIE